MIQRNGIGQRSARERPLEFGDVTRHDLGVEPHRIDPTEDCLAKRAAECVEKLLERMTRVPGCGLGPQVCEKLIATQSSFAGRGQQGEQCEPPSLM